jgi:hypothetical protein
VVALAAVLAVVAGAGAEAAPTAAGHVSSADIRTPDATTSPVVRLHRADLRSRTALAAAYGALFARRATAASTAVFLYGGDGADAVPVPDLDGDRGDDVLEVRGSAQSGAAVALRGGRRGAVRWLAAVPNLAGAEYVSIPGGRPLVVTYAIGYDVTSTPLQDVETLTLTVDTRDARTGASIWTASRTAVITYGLADEVVVGIPFVRGVLSGNKQHHPSLVIASQDYVFGVAAEAVRSRVELVDAVTGDSTYTSPTVEADAYFGPGGDLSGDGVEDVVEVSTADSTVTALSGVDGAQLWSVSLPAFDFGFAVPSPDINGDRRPDLLVASGRWDGSTQTMAAVDGRTGSRLWSRGGSGIPRPVGDVDRDGRSDTRLTTFSGRSVRYETVTGRGRTAWTTTVTITMPKAFFLSWLAGDLDGDGVQDSYVRLIDQSSSASDGVGAFVVDGRTGRLSQHPDLGLPLGDSLDGHGDDFVRTRTVLSGGAQRVVLTAVDGRSASALWSRQVAVASSAVLVDIWAGDFTATGRRDLLGVLTEPDRAVTVVQDGRSGRTAWLAGYAATSRGKEFYAG